MAAIWVGVVVPARRSEGRTPATWLSVGAGGLSLALILAMALRWEMLLFTIGIVIPEGGLSGLGGDPQHTYVVGTLTPSRAGEGPYAYFNNGNGVGSVAVPDINNCSVAEGFEKPVFGVFVDHYYPLAEPAPNGYFRVAISLQRGIAPSAAMARWERISALEFMERAIECRRVGNQPPGSLGAVK